LDWREDAVQVKADVVDIVVDVLGFEADVTRCGEARGDVWTAFACKRVAVDVNLTTDGTPLTITDDSLLGTLPG
jgi:hypothetical protein